MRCAALLLLVLSLVGCATPIGTGIGVVWGLAHNAYVDPAPEAFGIALAAEEERGACESKRQAIATAAATADIAEQREQLLVALPHCQSTAPTPTPNDSVHAVVVRAVIGLLVGAAIDGALYMSYVSCGNCTD